MNDFDHILVPDENISYLTIEKRREITQKSNRSNKSYI